METLGTFLVICGAGGLVLVGLYGLVPGLIASRGPGQQSPIRIEGKRLLAVADLAPRGGGTARKQAPTLPRPDARLAQELFSEIFSLRSEVASMTSELRSIREQLEGLGVMPAEDAAEPYTAASARVA